MRSAEYDEAEVRARPASKEYGKGKVRHKTPCKRGHYIRYRALGPGQPGGCVECLRMKTAGRAAFDKAHADN